MLPETSFFEILFQPLAQRYDDEREFDSTREYLNSVDPRVLHRTFKMGVNRATAAYSIALTHSTLNACERVVGKSQSLCDEMFEVWVRLEEYDRKGFFDGAAAGVFSGETATGMAIGTAIAPGIGTVVGAMVGGFLAGSKLDQDAARDAETFGDLWSEYFEQIDIQLERCIEPPLIADLEKYYAEHELDTDDEYLLESDDFAASSGDSRNIIIAAIIISIGMIVTALIAF